jgi:hypothetical protein
MRGFARVLEEWLGTSGGPPPTAPGLAAWPESLVDFYSVLHAAGITEFGHQDHLVPPAQLQADDDKVVFLTENQGVFRCAASLAPGNPEVWLSMNAEEWTAMPVALGPFLITFGMRELVFGSKYWASLLQMPTAWSETKSGLIWGNTPYVWEDCSFHLFDEMLVMLATNRTSRELSVWAGSKVPDSLLRLRRYVDNWNLE